MVCADQETDGQDDNLILRRFDQNMAKLKFLKRPCDVIHKKNNLMGWNESQGSKVPKSVNLLTDHLRSDTRSGRSR